MRLSWQGVPPSQRHTIWYHASGAAKRREERGDSGYYQRLLDEGKDNKNIGVIDKVRSPNRDFCLRPILWKSILDPYFLFCMPKRFERVNDQRVLQGVGTCRDLRTVWCQGSKGKTGIDVLFANVQFDHDMMSNPFTNHV